MFYVMYVCDLDTPEYSTVGGNMLFCRYVLRSDLALISIYSSHTPLMYVAFCSSVLLADKLLSISDQF